MGASILWYDLETFGLEPRYDRIAQVAAVRTNEDLEPLGDKLLLYCKPTPDYLPNPYSCLVHGVTPQYAASAGVREYDFASAIRAAMSEPGSTVAGFNSLKFDDEFIRNLLYRNLYDPYEREYKNGNSRWDLIDLMRAARDLRPEGLVWPEDETGRPIFTLGALAKANGVSHESAHDAMHDVLATIDLARLVKSRQPRLYHWYYSHRGRDSLRRLVDLVDRRPLVHSSVAYTSERGCTTLVAPVAMDPDNRNQLIAIDLRMDPSSVLDLPVEELRRRTFTKSELLDEERIPLARIRLNRCPFLAPMRTLSAQAAERLGIDTAKCLRHLDTIKKQPELIQKLAAVFDPALPSEEPADPELSLYSDGFFPDGDAQAFGFLHEALSSMKPVDAKAKAYALSFEDERPAQMIRRLFARNWPQTLSEPEARRWRSFCAARLQLPPLPGAVDLAEYSKVIEHRLENGATPARERGILLELLDYRSLLEREVMNYRGP